MQQKSETHTHTQRDSHMHNYVQSHSHNTTIGKYKLTSTRHKQIHYKLQAPKKYNVEGANSNGSKPSNLHNIRPKGQLLVKYYITGIIWGCQI